MQFPNIIPVKEDVEDLKGTFMEAEWYILPITILAFVVWLWPIACAAFAYALFKRKA